MAQQLAMFEPQGPEVLVLAQAHQGQAHKAYKLAESLDVGGWSAAASAALREVNRRERLAAEMFMLAEFEALGGVA